MRVFLILAVLSLVTPEKGAVVPADCPLRLSWRGETNAVYLLSVVRRGFEPQVFAVSNRTSASIGNLELASRFDWSVRLAGSLESAESHFSTDAQLPRLLRADGVRNLRDLGGGRTANGRRVRQNLIFRSASPRLTGVTDAGRAVLRDDLSIRTELDLRPQHDVLRARGTVLGPGVAWKSIPLEPGARVDGVVGGRESFARLFGCLSAKGNTPALVVDADGGARTATLAFLLNGLLGVREEDLRRDWNASPSVLKELMDTLQTLPGTTLESRFESYARGCGIADSEIAAFRLLMLEDECHEP